LLTPTSGGRGGVELLHQSGPSRRGRYRAGTAAHPHPARSGLSPHGGHRGALLQTAAVIGKDVPFPLLRAISDLPEEALCQGLMHLQACEFLYETKLLPESEYIFRHALTHEVAYESLLQERRRAVHARIVAVCQSRSTGTGPYQVVRRHRAVPRHGHDPLAGSRRSRPCVSCPLLLPKLTLLARFCCCTSTPTGGSLTSNVLLAVCLVAL
jgi:hypothetical protein